MLRVALSISLRNSRTVIAAARHTKESLLVRTQHRQYGDVHSMEDLLSASEAWHSLDPKRALDDEAALRRTFDKLDLDGNGFIDPDELRVALINMQGVPPAGEQFRSRTSPNAFSVQSSYLLDHMLDSRDAGFASFVLDAQVERMIHWADADKDGKISFSDYKKIITAGCTPAGRRTRKDPVDTPDVIHVGPPGWSANNEHTKVPHAYDGDGNIIHV